MLGAGVPTRLWANWLPPQRGPYYLDSLTDYTETIATVEDGKGKFWKRKTSDLSLYMGDA